MSAQFLFYSFRMDFLNKFIELHAAVAVLKLPCQQAGVCTDFKQYGKSRFHADPDSQFCLVNKT